MLCRVVRNVDGRDALKAKLPAQGVKQSLFHAVSWQLFIATVAMATKDNLSHDSIGAFE